MGSLTIASTVFACAFGSALLGQVLRGRLPEHHLSLESMEIVKLAIGLIATMVALILGLLTASAKTTFDTVNGDIQRASINLLQLDRALARYGPETNAIRDRLRQVMTDRLQLMWPEDGSAFTGLDTPDVTRESEGLEDEIRGLSPQTEAQRDLKSQALALSGELLGTRWHVFVQSSNQLPMAFLVMLVFWLVILFASFGVFAPRNATVLAALMLCALAVAGSILLILEMNRPLGGMIRVPSTPMRYAISQLGQ